MSGGGGGVLQNHEKPPLATALGIIVQLKLFQLVSNLFSASDVVSVNGSSVTLQCSSVTKSGGTLYCTDPIATSSVLFDGHIPIYSLD